MNRFLSLTLSHHYYRCNAFTLALPLSFHYALPVPRFLPLYFALSNFACPRPLSTLLLYALVWLVVGDGQHMACLWERECPTESIGPWVASNMSRLLGSVGVESGVGVTIGCSSSATVSVSWFCAVSAECRWCPATTVLGSALAWQEVPS